MELAFTQKKCLQEMQKGTTSWEFVLWKVFLQERLNRPEIEHYYLAQIAAEIRRVLAKKPREITFKDFLFKFKIPGRKEKPEVLTEEQKKEHMDKSKRYWFGLFSK